MDAPPLHVVGIVGSLRPNGHTAKVVRLALEGAAEMGALTTMIELRLLDLPFCDGRDDEDSYGGDAQRLRRELRSAQGIILGTPEYHGGYSGALKNALDLTGFDEFEGKMVGLVGVSGGVLGAANALDDLRGVGRALHAWVVPEQAAISRAERAFDEHGRLLDQRLAERVRTVGRQVVRFAYLHSSEQWREFLRLWEVAQPNPGAERSDGRS
ncbi:MAG TPA: NADPH-dependent FMN reductase [Candidatus Thermoplasmatota archaeon]|nr:NADPH-dependent FMN reductase [Candidatus Thermoplasmatota archaeon]